MKRNRGFTLIELLVVIAIIGILSGFIAIMMNGAVDAANDARRRTDISNLYTSILSSGTLAGTYPNLAADINGTSTPEALQQYINASTNQSPEDPTNKISYFYSSNGADFLVGAVLSNGECFVKSSSQAVFDESDCAKLKAGGIGLVQNFMILNGGVSYNLSWAVPAEYNVSSPTTSTALICLGKDKTDTSVPSESELFNSGTLVAIINGSNTYYYSASRADYNYFCKAVVYNNGVVSNPGTVGGSVNTANNGFTVAETEAGDEIVSSGGNYSSSSPSYSSYAASYTLPSIAGTTTTGGTQSETFTVAPSRTSDGSGTIALSWTPGSGSTHTIIRRAESTTANPSIAPQRLTDGVEVYNKRNDADGQNATALHSYTDTGLNENKYYCYSAWAYNQSTNSYSAGFVLACSGIPPSAPSGVGMYSSAAGFNLTWSLGSGSNTVIRRQLDTPATNQNEGVMIYNDSQIPNSETGKASLTDSDTALTQDSTYCYSFWSYIPSTQTLSSSYASSCGKLNMLGSASNLAFSSVGYNSMVLTWTKAVNSTDTIVVRKLGSVPSSRSDGTQIYASSGLTVMDSGLTDSTNYCYAVWGTNGTEYSASALTGCHSTFTTVCSAGAGLTCAKILDGDYIVERFTGAGSYNWTVPDGVTTAEYLVVGGGGGAGGWSGANSNCYWNGGGGAGGLITGTMNVTSGTNLSLTVGGGGVAGAKNVNGSNGSDSALGTLIAYGGGGGGTPRSVGLNGGSGGGGGGTDSGNNPAGGTALQPTSSTGGYGNNGGNGYMNVGGGEIAAAGGGGAGGTGASAGYRKGGAGGIGLQSSITGTSTYYAGGGGGCAAMSFGPCGAGGNGGGGAGAYGTGTPGTDGLGGGGGAGNPSARGGSGVVIIRYAIP